MEVFNLKLDDAPLIISTAYPASSFDITWTKQTEYLSPDKISKSTLNIYNEKLSWILRQYHALQKQDDMRNIAPHVLPYAAKVNMQLQATRGQLKNSISRLKHISNQYAQQLAISLSENLHTPLIEDEQYNDEIQAGIIQDRQRVRLVKSHPLNELELVAPLAFESSTLSWSSTLESLDSRSYSEKTQMLSRILRNNMLTNALRYQFELVVEPQVFRELQSKFSFISAYSQDPTPAHGYSVPKVNDGGMIERCFDMSYELYSVLQSVDPKVAPLACLYGHRQRYLVEIEGAQLATVFDRNVKLSQPAINIVKFMRKEISLKHPFIHEWFENKEETG